MDHLNISQVFTMRIFLRYFGLSVTFSSNFFGNDTLIESPNVSVKDKLQHIEVNLHDFRVSERNALSKYNRSRMQM